MAKKKKKKKTVEHREAPLTERQKFNMFMVLLRDTSAFTAASHRLHGPTFSEYDRMYAIVWEAAKAHFLKYGELPNGETLSTEIEARMDRDPVGLNDNELDKLNEFMDAAFNYEPVEADVKVAKAYLVRYLKERTIDQLRTQLLNNRDVPTNISELFSQLSSKAANIEALRGSAVESPFGSGDDDDESWRPAAVQKRSTGCPFFDEFLQGGDVRGEVYGLMGPYGSCKTTLGIELSVYCAHGSYRKWVEEDKDTSLGMSYYFIYEDISANYTMRALSCLCEIDIETFRNGDEFSTADNLKPYEHELFAAQLRNGAPVLGEEERYKIGKRILHHNWRVIDMTGNDKKNPGRGGGLVTEIRDIIQADLEANPNRHVDFICIDYVGASAKRFAAMSEGGSYDNLRHYIGDFPLQASNMLAGAFNTPVYLLHQLSGEQNSKKSGVIPDHTSAAEAKNFGENCNFNFQVGKPNEDNLAVFVCTKHRRAPPQLETIIQIDGRYSVVRSTHGKFVLDPASKSIVAADEAKKMSTMQKPKSGTKLPSPLNIGRFAP